MDKQILTKNQICVWAWLINYIDMQKFSVFVAINFLIFFD